jgi:hypothetical protein
MSEKSHRRPSEQFLRSLAIWADKNIRPGRAGREGLARLVDLVLDEFDRVSVEADAKLKRLLRQTPN